MRGPICFPRGKAFAATFAAAACWLLGLATGVAFAQGNAALNGPSELGPMRLVLGDLTVGTPTGCSVAYTLQVVTEVGPSNDDFELQVYDDGLLTQILPLSAPADGLIHHFSGTIELAQQVSQTSPGIGVYLIDSGTLLDFVDPVPVVCGVVEIPTLGSVGAWILGGLLLASALVILRRPRRSL